MQNKADFEILQNMGFNLNFIKKVYAFLHPESIQVAIEYMTTENGKYGHNFIENEENKSKCYICGFPLLNHINADMNNEEINENNITKGNDIKLNSSKNKNNICEICGENNSQMIKNEQCNDSFCYNCWINYLNQKINTNIIDKIPCMNYTCGKILSKKFIESLLKNSPSLLSKYEKFLERIQILNDPHKKFCPYPNCDSYAEERKETKFVKCKKNNHKFCYKCLKDHDEKISCDEELYKDFKIWKKNKIVKQCPNCKIWVQKIDGCNHVTCTMCRYSFCFVCLKNWIGHPDISCDERINEEMLNFFKPFNLRTEPEIENQNNNLIMITNISKLTSLDQLKKYMEMYGKIKFIDIIKENEIFAFCEYLSDKFAKRAIREKNLIIDGNKLVMKLINKEFKDNYYKEKEEKERKRLQAEYEKNIYNELCIKGLPINLKESIAHDFFETFGEMRNFKFFYDKGIAFCLYKSVDVAKNLVKKGTINYKGNILTVKYSRDKEFKDKGKDSFKQKDINKQNNYNINISDNVNKNENKNLNKKYTLFVGNLNYQTTEDGLKNFFNGYGVISARIITNQFGKSKGYGFVDFNSLDNLNKALLKNGKQLDSRNIRLNIESA